MARLTSSVLPTFDTFRANRVAHEAMFALVATLLAAPLAAQPLADPQEYEALKACIAQAQVAGDDFAVCKGVGAPDCDTDPAICTTGTHAAWTALGLEFGSTLLDRGESLPGFSKSAYLATLETRLSQRRDHCSAFPIGQETELADCLLDGEIGILRWMQASLDAMDAWEPGVGGLPPAAKTNLACMMAHPAQEGPELCGLPPFAVPCEDAACLWQSLEGWRALIQHFGEGAPGDLYDRLAANPVVPTSLTTAPMEAPAETLADIDGDCGDVDVGEDMLQACLFDAANAASDWLTLYQWYLGHDPRLRGNDGEQAQ